MPFATFGVIIASNDGCFVLGKFMIRAIRIDQANSDILKTIFEEQLGRLTEISNSICADEPKSLSVDGIASIYADRFDRRLVRRLISQSIGLRKFAIDSGLDSTHLERALRAGLSDVGWGDTHLAAFDEKIHSVLNIIYSDLIYLSGKYYELLSIDEKRLKNTKIYIDLIPVFNEGRKAVVASILSGKINMFIFDQNGDDALISVRVNISDIRKLKEECELALHKISIASKTMMGAEAMGIIVPEDD